MAWAFPSPGLDDRRPGRDRVAAGVRRGRERWQRSPAAAPVLAGAAPCLARRGIDTDAKQSRQIADAAEILDRTGERLPDRVIVHLGTNGGATASELDAVMSLLGPDRVVLFSTIQLPDDLDRYTYERATNDAIAALADRYDNVRIFDWEAVSALHPEWIYAEGIHMTPEGCRGYADLVEPQIRAP